MAVQWLAERCARRQRPYRVVHEFTGLPDQFADSMAQMGIQFETRYRALVFAPSRWEGTLFDMLRRKHAVTVELDPVEITPNVKKFMAFTRGGDSVMQWVVNNAQYPFTAILYYCACKPTVIHAEFQLEVRFTMPSDAMMFKLRFS